MPKHTIHQVDEKDAQDYCRALEEMYDVMVVLELRPSPSRVRGHWAVVATAYHREDGTLASPFRGEEARYPGANHATFGGAMLWAAHKLEMRLQAACALKQLPLDFG